MDLSSEEIGATIAKQYAPYIWFHKDEIYNPIEYRNLLCYSTLQKSNGDFIVKYIDDGDDEDLEEFKYIEFVVDYSKKHSDCRLNIPERLWASLWKGSLETHIYAWIRENEHMFIISYIVSFGYNGPTVCNRFGAHMMDIEHITVRVCKTSLQIKDVYFGAHQTNDGLWRKKGKFEEMNGRPVAYCAKNSHAMYPKKGNYPFALGFSIDQCNKGKLWNPAVDVISSKNSPLWFQYQGSDAIGTKPFLTQGDSMIQTTPLRRFFRIGCDCKCLSKKYRP